MKKSTLSLAIVGALALSACASNSGPLKAPCGPTAGMTDPCGNAQPINSTNDVDTVLKETA